MKSFASKVAVITGAGSGIGRALALELARRGALLALSDVDVAALADTTARCEAIGTKVRGDELDVSVRADVFRYANVVADHFGGVNLLVNNAGIAFTGSFAAMDMEEFQRIVDVDFWGVVNGSKAFIPHLIASGDGHLVNISSLYGLMAVPGQSAYASAKFAVRGFTETLRQEMIVGAHPVGVTVVHPGGVQTGIARRAGASHEYDQAELARLFDEKLAKTSAQKAAHLILRGVQRNRPRVLVGADARVLDLLVRVTAGRYVGLVAAATQRFMPRGRRPSNASNAEVDA